MFRPQLLSRRPPFGLDVITSARELPTYFLKVTETEVNSSDGKAAVEVVLAIECGLSVGQVNVPKAKKQKTRVLNMTAVFILTSDMDFVDFRRIPCVKWTSAISNIYFSIIPVGQKP
jgi:ATP-dependent DNA helicase HFM1/MER3